MMVTLYFLEGLLVVLTYKLRGYPIRLLFTFLRGIIYLVIGYDNMNKNLPYMRYIMIGLFLSFFGDLTLEKINELGIICFAGAHVFYVLGYITMMEFTKDNLLVVLIVTVVLTIFSLLVFYPFFKSKTKRGLHKLIFSYIIFLSVMVSISVGTRNHPGSVVRITGAITFYVSDICTAYVLWVRKSDPYWWYFRYGQLPLYYLAQILLAESG